MRRIIIGITGASGSLYGYMALQALRAIGGIETHLVLTEAARRTIELETEMTAEDFEALATLRTVTTISPRQSRAALFSPMGCS